jgi:hypothetical protein
MNNVISAGSGGRGVLCTTTSRRQCLAKLRHCLNVNFSLIYSDYHELFWEAWAMDTRPLLRPQQNVGVGVGIGARWCDLPAHRPSPFANNLCTAR